jgi:hypothetical protein
MNIFLFLVNIGSLEPSSNFNIAFIGKSASTNVAGLGTTYDVTSGDECTSVADYIVSNNVMINKLGRMWKEQAIAKFVVLSRNFHEVEENHEKCRSEWVA